MSIPNTPNQYKTPAFREIGDLTPAESIYQPGISYTASGYTFYIGIYNYREPDENGTCCFQWIALMADTNSKSVDGEAWLVIDNAEVWFDAASPCGNPQWLSSREDFVENPEFHARFILDSFAAATVDWLEEQGEEPPSQYEIVIEIMRVMINNPE